MEEDLDDFTANLNMAESDVDKEKNAAGQMQLPPGVTPEMVMEMKKQEEIAKKVQEEAAKKPLKHDPMKGKVDIKWFGHAGFKI